MHHIGNFVRAHRGVTHDPFLELLQDLCGHAYGVRWASDSDLSIAMSDSNAELVPDLPQVGVLRAEKLERQLWIAESQR
jgi:hypothetical protein